MSNHHLNDQLLLSVPIKDDEIFELLERLAATEEMFKTPVSTIRDVAELTEASPNLIARILGEMRDPNKLEKLESRIDTYDARLKEVEKKLKVKVKPETIAPSPIVEPVAKPVPKPKVIKKVELPKPPEKNVSIEAWKRAEKKALDQIEQKKNF